MFGRAIAAALLLVGLSGCNLVVSVDPWFSEADTQGVPAFRDGLWLSVADDCDVDTAQSPERWPECAGARILRGGEWLGAQWDTTGDVRVFAGWQPQPALIANGDPLIVQVYLDGKGLGSQPEDFPWRYLYAGLRPTEFDEEGKVVGYQSWGVRCGPEPEDDPTTPEGPGVTEQPFPGLKIVDDNCVADNADALRRAASLSAALGKPSKSRWVRDAER